MIDIYKIINKLMNPPAFCNDGGFGFLDWNESGFETGPRAGVML